MGKVTTYCYGRKTEWSTRKKAIEHYKECYVMSGGCEKERYGNILFDLLLTKDEVVYDYKEEY